MSEQQSQNGPMSAREEIINLERLVREYVQSVPCTCSGQTTCWMHVFKYNLGHLDNSRNDGKNRLSVSNQSPTFTSSRSSAG